MTLPNSTEGEMARRRGKLARRADDLETRGGGIHLETP